MPPGTHARANIGTDTRSADAVTNGCAHVGSHTADTVTDANANTSTHAGCLLYYRH